MPKRTELDVGLARQIMEGHGLTDANARFAVTPLGGGVSSNVLLVENGPHRYVLKQPLRRFRVRDDWIVDTARVRVEHEAARFFEQKLGSESIMPVVGLDEANEVLIVEAAPPGWTSWKERLLQGEIRQDIARASGALLGRIHALVGRLDDDGAFRHDDLFDQQRLDPYLRTAAAREPDLRGPLEGLVQSFGRRSDLVHGDYSPKNLLSNGFDLRLIDHEVVTRGDAAFDVAFLLNHLLLKAVHLPRARAEFLQACQAAFDGYRDHAPPGQGDLERRTVEFLGGLHLARAVGKSRAEYLTQEDQAIVVENARRMLTTGSSTLADAIRIVDEVCTQTPTRPVGR